MKSYPPIIPELPHVLFGGDYNPEQWPEEVWAEDARLMQKAGVNFLSVGIFAWARLEPSPGHYDADWLGRVLDLLHASGIGVCLATATASPPAWFTQAFPASRPVNADGVTLDLGSRQHYCPNSPDYRRASDALVRRIVRSFGRHPAVKMWHINNELGCHVPECHCSNCQAAFPTWLRKKYGTLERLNEAWGTTFWSQLYTAWDQLRTPRRMPTLANPGQMLDYRRFYSESLRKVVDAEVAVIRAEGNTLPVTTNGIGFFPPCDYFDWYEHFDFAAWDSYPDPINEIDAARTAAFGHDLNRSLKKGKPFLLMEQVTSQVNWRPVNMLKPPGAMRAQNLQAVGRGADACMFFQWRASKSGAEKFHGALVPHFGPQGRIFHEVRQLGHDLGLLDAVLGAPCPAETTILCSWENRWALDVGSKPTKFDYAAMLEEIHGAMWKLNIPTQFAPPSWEIPDGTRLVIAPLCYLLSESEAARLRAFVKGGGTLVMTYFSGIADQHEHIGLGGYPAKLADVLGLRVEEWQPYPEGRGNAIVWADGRSSRTTKFSEILHVEGAEVVATYTEDFFAGSPAVTANSFGSGRAWYVSTHLAAEDWQRLLAGIADEANVKPVLQTNPGVEVALRCHENEAFYFVINHNLIPTRVSYGHLAGLPDILNNSNPVPDSEDLEPLRARVIHRLLNSDRF